MSLDDDDSGRSGGGRTGGGGSRLPRDEFVSRLVSDAKALEEQEPVIMMGYLGDSDEEGFTRVYGEPTLSEYTDVRDDDVLHVQPVCGPDQGGLGGHMLWVRKDAKVAHGGRGQRKQKGTFFDGPITQGRLGAATAAAGGEEQRAALSPQVITRTIPSLAGCPSVGYCPTDWYGITVYQTVTVRVRTQRSEVCPSMQVCPSDACPSSWCYWEHVARTPVVRQPAFGTVEADVPQIGRRAFQAQAMGAAQPAAAAPTAGCPSFGFTCTAFCPTQPNGGCPQTSAGCVTAWPGCPGSTQHPLCWQSTVAYPVCP